MSDKKEFLLNTPALLRTLDPNQRPIWGLMSPQHLVEHIVGAWRISNGRAQVKCVFQGEELEKRRAFLFSDAEYARNITNPVTGNGLPPLRKTDLEASIVQLEAEMHAFFEYHTQNPNAIEMHPAFGALDYQGWIDFQYKHMRHHMMQFELV
jgi:hypothetical protein